MNADYPRVARDLEVKARFRTTLLIASTLRRVTKVKEMGVTVSHIASSRRKEV